MPSIHDFATWEPVLRVLRASNEERLAAPGGYVTGQIGVYGWSVPVRRRSPEPGRAAQVEDMQDEWDAVEVVRNALLEAGTDDIAFVAEISPAGRTVLHLISCGPAADPGIAGPYPGSLLLVEDAVAEPWRRLPDPMPGAVPAPSADPAQLERTLRERLPDAIGATEAEIAAAEARLGVTLPDELKALYRVTRARWADWGDYETAEVVYDAVGCELLALEDLFVADASSRPCRWEFAAMEAVVTPPDAAVQQLVGSPGWIVFGGNGGGDRIAVDLTPGPRGHLGQIVMLSHEWNIGAELLADSLTDLVLNGESGEAGGDSSGDRPPAVVRVNSSSLTSIQAAAHPGLEALSIGVWDGEPFSLAPLTGLPRLRTLTAYSGTLADPQEIAKLTGLEFLKLGPQEWRALLAAGAVPRSLSAAAIQVDGAPHPLPIVDLANEILALWDRPPITRTVLEGDLGPEAA